MRLALENYKAVTSVSAIVLALGAAQQGAAQDIDANADGAAQTEPARKTAAASAPAVGEIIVTAQRREERLRDVPVSVAAFGDQQLEASGIDTVGELQVVTPGLRMERIGTYQIPALRGVSTVLTDPTTDASVGIYLDGVYQPGLSTTAMDLPDVERVEVLKGPQGTLFGRNTSGGAIRIITKKPSYDFTGSVTASYGNFDAASFKGFISGPLVDDMVAFSLAGNVGRSDSYYRNIVPGPDGVVGGRLEPKGNSNALIRGKLLIEPSDNLSILLAGRYSDQNISSLYSVLDGNSASKQLDPDTIVATRPYDVALNSLGALSIEVWDLSATIDLDLGSGVLSSVTGYTKGRTDQVQDSDGAYAPNGRTNMFYAGQAEGWFSQDLSFTSTLDGPFNFIVGASYFDGQGEWDPLGVDLGFGPENGITIYGIGKVKSAAGFGEITYEVTDRLTLIGGLRYSWEERQLNSDILFNGVDVPKPDGALTFRGRRSWDRLTPRASIRYALTDRDNVYFTYSEGFKSGLITTNYVGPTDTLDVVDPETIIAYEIGYKGNVSDNISLNLAAFYYDQQDVQQLIYQFVGDPPAPLSRSLNAANAEIYGVEGDAVFRFGPSFELSMAATYLNSTILDFPNSGSNVPLPGNSGNQTLPFDASGQTNILSPKFTMTATPTVFLDVANGELVLTGNVYYSSKSYYTLDHRVFQDGYVTIGARASWSPYDSGLKFSIFGENLTDEAVLGGAFVFPTGDNVLYKPPLTYGAAVSFSF